MTKRRTHFRNVQRDKIRKNKAVQRHSDKSEWTTTKQTTSAQNNSWHDKYNRQKWIHVHVHSFMAKQIATVSDKTKLFW